MRSLFHADHRRVWTCDSPSKSCDSAHYAFLASAARVALNGVVFRYHIGTTSGEIEICEDTACREPEHFDSRAAVVSRHRETYSFSGKWRALANPYESLLEGELAYCLNTLGFRMIRGTRDVIGPYELDIFFPDVNVAFEFNGTHWHSDEVLSSRYGISAREYHRRKFLRAEELGVSLGFVWEKSWLQDSLAVVDLACDAIQFRRLSKMLTSFDKAPAPAEFFWTASDRHRLEQQRMRVTRRLEKSLVKGRALVS